MIERKFVAEKLKEYQIEEFVGSILKRAGHSHTKMQRTPLGEKIIIYTSRPGLAVGKKGQSIKNLTKDLKNKFELENPQIEISEVMNYNLDPQIVADSIAASLEKYGTNKFKGIGHKAMTDVMNAGALGVEITISGKIPSARAKRWRFYMGYLKKCGDIANQVLKAKAEAQLKTGTVGIQVSIMPPDLKLPDHIEIKSNQQEGSVNQKSKTEKIEEQSDDETKKEDETESVKEEAEKEKKKTTTKRKTTKKKEKKSENKE